MSRYRVAVDVGGTFTDLIVHDEETGSVAIAVAVLTSLTVRSLPTSFVTNSRGPPAGGGVWAAGCWPCACP